MSFVSYAQNNEDVMLWRALKNIENGFYIDVGANDPEIDSVTKLFYDNGWRGINIEPVSQWYDRLEEYRIRDINLQIAVGNTTGKMTLYELPDTGLSTADLAIAERHEKEKGYKKVKLEVQVKSLTNICKEYHEAPIHFLKIDVEGAEKAVLEGFDLMQIRPWIIVIESTLPNTQIEDYEHWENHILDAEYEFVYFDGLNRYYIAKEHEDLKCYFNVPPNIFDGFITQQQFGAESQAQTAVANAAQLRAKLSQSESTKVNLESTNVKLEAELCHLKDNRTNLVEEVRLVNEKNAELNQLRHHWNVTANQLDEELKAVYASKSWRIMLLLRKIMHLIIHLLHQSRQLVKTSIISAMRFIIKQPLLKEISLKTLAKFPRLKANLNNMALKAGLSTKTSEYRNTVTRQSTDLTLSPRASRIYAELKQAIENKGN